MRAYKFRIYPNKNQEVKLSRKLCILMRGGSHASAEKQ